MSENCIKVNLLQTSRKLCFIRSANFQTNLTAKSLKTVKTSVLANDNCFAWLEPFFDTPAS